jgi:hypothetical protein
MACAVMAGCSGGLRWASLRPDPWMNGERSSDSSSGSESEMDDGESSLPGAPLPAFPPPLPKRNS